MREYKFRAKCLFDVSYSIEAIDKPHKQGEWFYFTLQKIWGQELLNFIDWSTLGMRTTKLDKNGKEIYEGDKIFWEKQDGVWCDQAGKTEIVKFPFICNNAHLCEIIGTKFDTPDLLTVSKKKE